MLVVTYYAVVGIGIIGRPFSTNGPSRTTEDGMLTGFKKVRAPLPKEAKVTLVHYGHI